MGVASFFEFITTLFSWIIYDGIWSVLVDTGIVFLPFIAMIITNALSSHRAGDDEGNAGLQSLKKVEADFYVMIAVIVFAGIPALSVELGEMEYVRPALTCGDTVETIPGTDTGTTYDRTLAELGDQQGGIPIWWAAIHVLSKSITAAAVASIPCSNDLASVEYRLANDGIDDPGLRKEIQEFTNDCYRRSKSRLLREDTSGLTLEQLDDTNWLGSQFFLTEPGYYNYYYSQDPRADFPFDATRDAGFESSAGVGGHPRCNEWWLDGTDGIRAQVLASIDPDMLDDMVYDTNNLIDAATDQTLSQAEREDVFLRKYLAINRVREAVSVDLPMSTGYRNMGSSQPPVNSDGSVWSSLGSMFDTTVDFVVDTIETGIAAAGGIIKAPSGIGEGVMIRQGISMFQSLALMVFVIILPFLMVFSQYKLSTLMTLTIIFFGMHFMTFLWAVAFWMENNLMNLLTQSEGLGAFAPMTNPVQSGIILWMERFMYIIFPMLYLASLGWVGISAGTFATQMQNYGNSAAAPGAAGGNLVTTAATKGKA
ncbi:MAG: conjugal transfer protein TraG N-terminal domain-containing protein [Pseudomonadota bacterium]